MDSYRQTEYGHSVERLSDNAFIPFDLMNTDYQKFKVDITNGATLEDPTGTTLTADQIKAFMEILP